MATLVQGVIALVLVVLGTGSRSGFETMVEYTAPVFWFFIMLVGISLIVLRFKYPSVHRPFTVPLYPVVPVIFIFTCAYMLYSSLRYTGLGAAVGVAVLLSAIPLLIVNSILEGNRK